MGRGKLGVRGGPQETSAAVRRLDPAGQGPAPEGAGRQGWRSFGDV